MKFNSRQVLIFLIIIILISSLLWGVSLLFTQDINNIKVGSPEITVLETASSITTDPPSYTPSFSFVRGQKIYVYQEFINVSHGGKCDFYLNISLKHENGQEYGYIEDNVKIAEQASFYFFTSDSSWPTGFYTVSTSIVDYISNEKDSKIISFLLQ
ncbi:MAG: hypothetical protein JSW62_04590 [Thermoplasmatales archaeon]|nr:MAG: hypothetical protein JSW62_04590 [Thermoplasmatales archaeon]